MHIPENYLSPVTCAVMGAAMIPVRIHAVKKTNEGLPQKGVYRFDGTEITAGWLKKQVALAAVLALNPEVLI